MEWDFDETIRGTVKGMPVHLDLEALDATIDQAAGPQQLPSSANGSSAASTVKMKSPNLAEGDAEATSTVRPLRKEVGRSDTQDSVAAPMGGDLGELEIQDARCVGAIRDGFSELASRNPELIARLVDQLMGEMRKGDFHGAPESSDDDLITDRSPIAELLYQRCEWIQEVHN